MAENRSITILPRATALTIAGSDPSGGAGLQADLKTFQQFGVYGMSVVTLLTVQNTQRVSRVEVLDSELVSQQLAAVLDDIPPVVIKTGALGNAEVVEAVASGLASIKVPIVADPVLVSKHGHSLASDDVVAAYKKHLLPLAFLVTPNRFEAERLTGLTLDNEEAVAEAIFRLQQYGAKYVLLKLGEVGGKMQHILSLPGQNSCMMLPRLAAGNTHGTGCILSAAITASMARGQTDLQSAVMFGMQQTYQAIDCNTELGQGIHPAETRVMLVDL